jgi:uncharacterized protein YcsI (UPF0317 family)
MSSIANSNPPPGALQPKNVPCEKAFWVYERGLRNTCLYECKSCGERKRCSSTRAIGHLLGLKLGWKACVSPNPEHVAFLKSAEERRKILKPKKRPREEVTLTPTLQSTQVRAECRAETFTKQTSGQAPGIAQANLVILPKEQALDFMLFCQRNSKACPILEVLEAGEYLTSQTAADADVRTDLPKYRVYTDGNLIDEPLNIINYWREDLVTFLIGCSFSFEEALLRAGLPIRHIENRTNVPMYNTNIPCKSSGVFSGNLVVSMRPMLPSEAIKAVEITSRYPRVHGAPIHLGNPEQIGIHDILSPDFGDPVDILPGEIPVFWPCGVTPQAVVMNSRPPFCITHSPGHMLVLDITNDQLSLS